MKVYFSVFLLFFAGVFAVEETFLLINGETDTVIIKTTEQVINEAAKLCECTKSLPKFMFE